MEFLGDFFMAYDIDIHELNLRPFRYLKFMDAIFYKKCVFCILNNKCIIISFFRKKATTISNRRRFYRWVLHYFFNFFYLIMFYEP
jgi:hypothetical protein